MVTFGLRLEAVGEARREETLADYGLWLTEFAKAIDWHSFNRGLAALSSVVDLRHSPPILD